MSKIVLTFGVIAGLIVSIMMVLTMTVFDQLVNWDNGMVIGYATMLAAFLMIYFGVRSYRDNVAGGSVKFGRAFVVGASIALIASVMYTATWQVIYYNFKPDYIEKYQEHQMTSAREKGVSQEELDKMQAEMATFAEQYKNPLVNIAFTMVEILPLGLLVAAISAGILSRRRQDSRLVTA
jgi:hypothetical protein